MHSDRCTYTALMVSTEVGAAYSHNPDRAERAILDAWQDAASVWLPPDLQPPDWSKVEHIGHLGTASPFNLKVRSFTLRNFNLQEVTDLYAQHTEATGQVFYPRSRATGL
jgi:hypothetical protein